MSMRRIRQGLLFGIGFSAGSLVASYGFLLFKFLCGLIAQFL